MPAKRLRVLVSVVITAALTAGVWGWMHARTSVGKPDSQHFEQELRAVLSKTDTDPASTFFCSSIRRVLTRLRTEPLSKLQAVPLVASATSGPWLPSDRMAEVRIGCLVRLGTQPAIQFFRDTASLEPFKELVFSGEAPTYRFHEGWGIYTYRIQIDQNGDVHVASDGSAFANGSSSQVRKEVPDIIYSWEIRVKDSTGAFSDRIPVIRE